MRASIPGAREILARKYFSTLGSTTLRTLLDGDGPTPPILPAGTYRHNKTAHTIRINGGGEIIYVGCDTPEKLGSINASGCAIDEAAELSKQDLIMLRGRCRLQPQNLKPQTYMVTNPQGPLHHLATHFGLDGHTKPAPKTLAILMATSENYHLPQDYVDELDRLTGADRARLFEGKWVQAEGLVYPDFDMHRMVKHRKGPWEKVVVGQDAGFNDPDVMLVVCKDAEGNLHVAQEFYENQQSMDKVVEAAKRIYSEFHPAAFAVDPSAARLRDELYMNHSLPVVKAENPILDGIRAVQRYMVVEGDGTRRFTIDPSCKNTIRELGSYAWAVQRTGETKDVPTDKWNHAMDALRYAVMELDGRSCFCGVVPDVNEYDDDEEDGWLPVGQRMDREAFGGDFWL